MPKLFKISLILFSLVWCFNLTAQQEALFTDSDPDAVPQNFTDTPGDFLAAYDIDALTGETGNLGCEYAFGYLWVTARGLVNPVGSPENQLWKIDISGTPVVVASYPQGNTDAWGWRDLCSDGTYLYASVTNLIEQIDPTTGLATGVTIPGPITPNRALAYDPATDHFWTASFSSDLYEIDRTGTIINQYPSVVSMYGAGWDGYTAGGPWLWVNGDPGSTLSQVDPVTGIATGLSYPVSATAVDGGMDIDQDLYPGLVVGVALIQGAPDSVVVVEIDVPVPVELTSFAASVNENDVTLNWSTATELNNMGFEVQRSNNGGYISVGFVDGNGTTTEIQNYAFTDKNIDAGSYTYRLKQVDFNGTFEYSDAVEVDVTVPDVFALEQNYPNPFNPSTMITFSLAADSKVTLTVFDVLGQEVANLISGNLAAGSHEINFNASNINSSVYFYRIDATAVDGTNFTSVKKMILTK